MAAPVYSTDLSPINLSTGTWGEFTGASEGSGPTENDIDNFIAGANSTTEAVRNDGLSSMYCDYESNATVASGDAVFFWCYFAAMASMDTFANHGFACAMGHDPAHYKKWDVFGSNTKPYGGWLNYAIDPTASQSGQYGSPSGALRYFGGVINLIGGISKGNAFAMDYIREGRSLIVTEGDSGSPGTFAGAAAINDATSARWGLFSAIDGGFSMKGLFQVGSAGTAAYFEDENINIVIEDTIHCGAGFNEFEVLNDSSVVNLTGVQMSALGSQSPGLFTVTDNAAVALDRCTFNDMGAFSLLSNTTIDNTTFRRCGQVTQDGAVIDECVFDNSPASASLLADDIGLVTNCSFVSDNSNHAIQLTSTGEYNLIGHSFTNYATSTGDTGNEVIYNNSGGAVTLNASENSGVISYRNGSGASTTIESTVNVSITANVSLVGAEVRIYDLDTTPPDYGTELAGIESNGTAGYIYAGTDGNGILIQVLKDGYVEFTQEYTMPSTNSDLGILLRPDGNI